MAAKVRIEKQADGSLELQSGTSTVVAIPTGRGLVIVLPDMTTVLLGADEIDALIRVAGAAWEAMGL